MKLFWVERASDAEFEVEGPLARLLTKFYMDIGERDDSERELIQAELKKRHHLFFLRCGCSNPSPLLKIVKKQLYFIQHYGEGRAISSDHNPDCELSEAQLIRRIDSERELVKVTDWFTEDRKANSGSDPLDARTHPEYQRIFKGASLYRKLIDVLVESGLSRIHSKGPRGFSANKEAFKKALEHKKLRHQPLLDQFIFSPWELCRLEDIIHLHIPQGYALLTPDALEGEDLIFEASREKRYPVGSGLIIHNREGRGLIRGPLLVLGSMTKRSAPKLKAAYALPVLSKTYWFPVDSHFERRVAERLAKIASSELGGKHRVVLEKPLGTMNGVVPDFLLYKWGSEKPQVVIEVLGYDNEEYRADKKKKEPLYRELGRYYVEFDASRAERLNCWEAELKHLENKVKKLLGLSNKSLFPASEQKPED